MTWIRRFGHGLPAVPFSHTTVKFVSMSQDLMLLSTEEEILLCGVNFYFIYFEGEHPRLASSLISSAHPRGRFFTLSWSVHHSISFSFSCHISNEDASEETSFVGKILTIQG